MTTDGDSFKSQKNREVDNLGLMIPAGHMTHISDIHKFGRNDSVGNSFVPVSMGGIYQTPQVSGATTLRIKSGGNAADTAAGAGARKVILEGLDETGALVTAELTTAGASASAATTTTFLRLFRIHVSESGVYATASAGSHVGDITIENGAGGTTWGAIQSNGFPRSQSEIGVYTVPLGKTAYITSIIVSVDSSKAADVLFFKRENILETVAPYTAMRVVLELGGITGEEIIQPISAFGPFPALTDVGVLAKVASGTAEADIDFEIILIDE